MAQQQPQNAAQDNENKPSFSLQRTYVKDLSVEMPNAPQIFLEQETPAVEVDINVGAQRLSESIFETTVLATVTTRINDQILYLVEATQAGIFEAANIPDDQLNPLLGIVCPTMLYPYLRAPVAHALNRTSLPPLALPQVHLLPLHEQSAAEATQQLRQTGDTQEAAAGDAAQDN